MKVKFTKRSQKDKDLVTVSLSQFRGTEFEYYATEHWRLDNTLILSVEGIPVVFTFSRRDKNGDPTVLTSRGLPRSIRLPRVGRPIYAEVTE